ncbi:MULTISPECIES: S41 family peptidase [Pseudoalteromonas]|uniref:Tail specific protease domain-containing protein n=1 Tax=Pseudoalteromonas amylolytica TaxID=1859457 RepID=A0A1S1MPE9_9GAMM|nr:MULTISPECIES: S41 family peptidase [Pseudoalteromonas]OHU84258.1 hypothetical protein BFC16_01005 [Pseudoalteromonas sp. JW3]OHU87201.1 hypothetical protein BET10_00930 [Pseudoalteromonas amylolytica]
MNKQTNPFNHLLGAICLVMCLFSNAETSVEVPISAEQRLETLQLISNQIEQGYVLPKVANQVASALLELTEQGRFDHIETRQQFIAEIDQQLRDLSNDGHLGLVPMRTDKVVTHILQESDEKRNNNFAFEQAKVLSGNVGYLKFNKLHPDERAMEVATYALNFLSHTSHLVIDLRECGGGSMELVRHLISHFVKDKTHLWDIFSRDGFSYSVESYAVVAQARLQSMPITILTSRNVISAAEFFTYTLKHLGRAQVVGEQTAGLAHATGVRQINDWLVLRLPLMRPVNPTTLGNWEQVGIKPDIEVPQAQALVSALAKMQPTKQ